MTEYEIQVAEDIKCFFQAKYIDYDFSAEQAKVNNDSRKADRIRYDERLLALLNYTDKIVNPIPRKVMLSDALNKKISNSSLPEEIKNEVNRFKELFTNGDDVNNHLSKTVFDPERIDYAFNLWRIKHFHLNSDTTFEKNAMSGNRSSWLLFAIVNDDTAYFLDVRNHPRSEGFTALSFFEIIADSGWLPEIGYCEIPGILSLDCNEDEIHTDTEIYALIKAGINRPFKYDGKYYMGGLTGTAASGDSLHHTDLLIKLNNIINRNPSWEYKELVEIRDLAGVGFKFIDKTSGKELLVALLCNKTNVEIFELH